MTEVASLTGAGGFVYDASFCPPDLLPQFANLPGDAAAPPYLIDLFASLTACEQAFPNCAKFGYLSGNAFALNSLDWAVVQEAVAYCEQTPSQRTVWMQEGAYGVAGTIKMTQGTQIIGQGAMGSGPVTGTGIAHFSNDDLFLWIPTAAPFTVNNDATGGGARSLSCWKANRLGAAGGRSYGGGATFHGVAATEANRAGEFLFLDILVASEAGPAPAITTAWQPGQPYAAGACVTPVNGYYYTNLGPAGTSVSVPPNPPPDWNTTIGSTTTDNDITWTCAGGVALWANHFFADGSACTTPGGAGTRSWHFYKVRTAGVGTPAGSVLLDTTEHVHGSLQIDNGNSPDGYSGLTIQGDSNDIQLRLELQTFVIIQADGAPAGRPLCAITAVASGTSPQGTPQATITVSPALPFGSASATANVSIQGAQASPSIDGFAVASFVTAGDTSTFTIPVVGPVSWIEQGTVQSTGPRSLTLDGKIDNVVVYNADSTGCVNQTSDVVPGTQPVQQYAISKSPYLRFNGQNPPAFRLALVDATSQSLTGAVTGTGEIIVVPFNTLSYDKNGDLNGLTSPYTRWTCYCAGVYRVRARVCVAGLSGSNTVMTLQIYQVFAAGGDVAYSSLQNVITTTEGTYQVIEVTDAVPVGFADTLEVRLIVDGTGEKAAATAFADTGSGLTAFSAELL
jgi:hypothetical protein